MAKTLTPAAVDAADYPIAQSPALGGETEVFMTHASARVLGVLTYIDDSAENAEWDPVNLPTDSSPGPIICLVQGELRSTGTAVGVTYGGLTGSFTPSAWSRNQTFDFPVGRAIELDGEFAMPASLVASKPTVTNAKRGTKLAFIEMPAITDFKSIGVSTNTRIKLPTATTKFIAKHLESSYWTTRGRTEVGQLDFTSLDMGYDDGLMRFAGTKCQVMVRVLREGKVLVRREFYLDYVPTAERDAPEGDGESTLSVSGMFSRAAVLVAP